MVFELVYLVSDRRAPGERALRKGLERVDYLSSPKKVGQETHFKYRNPDTQVTCRFIIYAPEDDEEAGLAFEMDLPRPRFFALEALPLAVLVARELRLRIDLLTSEEQHILENPTVEDLLDEWERCNREEVEELGSVPCGDANDLEAMWEFMMLRSDLVRRYGRRSVAVPPVKLLKLKKSDRALRYAEWKGLGLIALPDVDWVKLVNPPGPLKDDSFYPAEEFFPAVKPMVRDVPQPVYHHLCDRKGVEDELVDAIVGLKRKTARSFDFLDYDQITDC